MKCTVLVDELSSDCKIFISFRDNDDYEILQPKDFQGPFTSHSETFKILFCFQGLSRPWKNGHIFKDFQGHSL